MDEARIRQLSSRTVYRNPWLELREDDVEFPDGSTGLYSVVDKRDFVVVLAHERREGVAGIWMVQQFRYPIGRREWEFPQGGWPADRDGPPAELAAAELREETGLRADELRHLGRLFACYGFCSQSYDVFLATGLTTGPTQRESTESDMVHEWRSLDDIRSMVRTGELADAHSIAALALLDLDPVR
ncbi:MAG TPA: NUDIX hydrolase [Jatrophihabitans sp.]|jgi:8-oxo-dGTP pyrophosphatase MutT (NUDIX family)|uniref:NUDIX hydrolase n=1 Tax=Jatrophihabitans sp. TaxID=1932789 RepID=UPI002E011958|nr:NUDIX hydrolase [Jatrophihabitans sp.]